MKNKAPLFLAQVNEVPIDTFNKLPYCYTFFSPITNLIRNEYIANGKRRSNPTLDCFLEWAWGGSETTARTERCQSRLAQHWCPNTAPVLHWQRTWGGCETTEVAMLTPTDQETVAEYCSGAPHSQGLTWRWTPCSHETLSIPISQAIVVKHHSWSSPSPWRDAIVALIQPLAAPPSLLASLRERFTYTFLLHTFVHLFRKNFYIYYNISI